MGEVLKAAKVIESPTRELASVDAQERAELAEVVASIVVRGDISLLTPEQRTKHYLRVCERLRLDPTTQPLTPMKVQGREILYPNKGASDQLAAIWGVDRELFERPHVVDTGAGKIIQAACRAVWRGRVDVSTGAVPVPSGGGEALCNALLKAESKAKRRATLSILGLGMLDETEVEAIPASAKSPAAPIVLQQQPEATPAEPPAETSPAPTLANFYAYLEQIELPGECVAAWVRYRDDLAKLPKADGEAAWTALCKRCEDVGKMKNAKAWLKRAIAEEDARVSSHEPDGVFNHATTTPAQSSVASDDVALETTDAPAFDALREDLDALDADQNATLLQAARVWRKHKDAVYAEAGGDAEHLYAAQQLVLGVTKVGCTRNQLNEHVQAIETRETSRDNVFTDVMDLLELADSAEDVAEIARKHKPAIDLRAEEIRELLRNVAVRRVQELVPGMADAKQASRWLKNALAPKDPPKPPSGGTPKPEATPANDGDPERDATTDADHTRENNQFAQADSMPPAQALRTRLAECKVTKHLYNTLFKYGPDLVTKEQGAQICAERMVETGAHLVSALKAVREEIDRRGWKRSRRAA